MLRLDQRDARSQPRRDRPRAVGEIADPFDVAQVVVRLPRDRRCRFDRCEGTQRSTDARRILGTLASSSSAPPVQSAQMTRTSEQATSSTDTLRRRSSVSARCSQHGERCVGMGVHVGLARDDRHHDSISTDDERRSPIEERPRTLDAEKPRNLSVGVGEQ